MANNDHISDYSSETDDTEILIGEQVRLAYLLVMNGNNKFVYLFVCLSVCLSVQEVQRRLTERTHLLRSSSHASELSNHEHRAIGFFGACRIPGVVEFSLSLFFSKLVSYTFLYWLPLYLKASSECNSTYHQPTY